MSQLTSVANSQFLASNQTRSKRMPSFLFADIEQANSNSHILKQSVISNFQHSQYSIMCRAPSLQLISFQALASFLFVFGCSCQNNPQDFELHTLYGIFLLFAICLSGSLTGANINPSITLSNYLRKQNSYTLKMIPIYFMGQFIGALLGLIAAIHINGVQIRPIMPNDTDPITVIREGANQMMGTIVIVFFILEITNPNTTFIQNQISGFLSIVLFFYLAIMLCPETNSFATNFAIILAVNLSSSIYQGKHDGWEWIWVYLLGQILGVIIATLFYDRVFEPMIKKLRQARRQSLIFSQYKQDQDQP